VPCGGIARSASGFLKRLIDQAPFIIAKVLTDNGKEFTDRISSKNVSIIWQDLTGNSRLIPSRGRAR